MLAQRLIIAILCILSTSMAISLKPRLKNTSKNVGVCYFLLIIFSLILGIAFFVMSLISFISNLSITTWVLLTLFGLIESYLFAITMDVETPLILALCAGLSSLLLYFVTLYTLRDNSSNEISTYQILSVNQIATEDCNIDTS